MAKKAYVFDGSAWQDLSSSISDLSQYANMNTTPISGFRNAIINGDFRINQRNLTSTGITTNSTYGFDRWRNDCSGGTVTMSAQAFTVGSPAASGYESQSFLRQVVSGQSAVGNYAAVIQPIEDVRTFAGTVATLSFWAKAGSGTPKIAVELQQKFGSGGSPSADVFTAIGQITLSTSWTRYSITTTVPSISGKTIGTTANTSQLGINLWTSAGSDFNTRSGSLGIQNNTFDIWGVQLERGSVATPFEYRPVGTELALCQRYYETSYSNGVTPGTANASVADCGGWAASDGGSVLIIKCDVKKRRVITGSDVRIWSALDATPANRVRRASDGTIFSVSGNINAWGQSMITAGITSGTANVSYQFGWDVSAEL